MSSEKRSELSASCEMLPWYVNGTLNKIEVRAVENHLRDCETCTSELPVLVSLQKSLRRETVAVLAPAPNVEQFIARLDRSVLRRFPSKAAWIAGALAAGIAVFAIALKGFFAADDASPRAYQTVTGTGSSESFHYVLHVSFDQQLDDETQLGILQSLEPVSVAKLEAAGDYRVVVQLNARSVEDLEQYRLAVERNSTVSSVSIVALELPMESEAKRNDN